MGQPIHAPRREPRRFGRVALTALVIGLGGAALATFPLDNLAFAGNGNGGGKGGGNGGGHGHDGGHGGGKGGGQGNSGGGQGNGEGRSNDGPGNSANAGKADPDAAQSSDDDAATDDSTTDDGSMAPSKLGKLNGFFHASPNGLANASPNSSIGRISHTFKEALSDFAAASQTPADPNATPPSGPSVDDLGAILAGATNKQVTAAQVQAIVDRLRGVVIERRPALRVLEQYDAPDALHFVDPPYVEGVRGRAGKRSGGGGVYRHEMTDEQHGQLIEALQELQGMVVLCGYPSDLYDAALGDWKRVELRAYADGALERTEVLWINQAASRALSSGPLFELVA